MKTRSNRGKITTDACMASHASERNGPVRAGETKENELPQDAHDDLPSSSDSLHSPATAAPDKANVSMVDLHPPTTVAQDKANVSVVDLTQKKSSTLAFTAASQEGSSSSNRKSEVQHFRSDKKRRNPVQTTSSMAHDASTASRKRVYRLTSGPWVCQACTFRNTKRTYRTASCEVCHTQRRSTRQS